jgi:protein-disulfide isomerase
MKVPEKVIPLLFVLLLVAAFLLGRYQAQVEFLGSGKASQLANQAGTQDTGQALGQTAQQGQSEISEEMWKKILENPAASKGEGGAPVVMVEYSDYQCPYCVKYVDESFPQIEKDYIDTGKVRYLFRDLPLPFHENALPAALAARCAGDQDKYWEMHDILFEKQGEWSSGDPGELFKGYAGELGLDSKAFSACFDGEKYLQEINADLDLAQQVGADGTPAFFINGERIIGALPISTFKQAIDAEL